MADKYYDVACIGWDNGKPNQLLGHKSMLSEAEALDFINTCFHEYNGSGSAGQLIRELTRDDHLSGWGGDTWVLHGQPIESVVFTDCNVDEMGSEGAVTEFLPKYGFMAAVKQVV